MTDTVFRARRVRHKSCELPGRTELNVTLETGRHVRARLQRALEQAESMTRVIRRNLVECNRVLKRLELRNVELRHLETRHRYRTETETETARCVFLHPMARISPWWISHRALNHERPLSDSVLGDSHWVMRPRQPALILAHSDGEIVGKAVDTYLPSLPASSSSEPPLQTSKISPVIVDKWPDTPRPHAARPHTAWPHTSRPHPAADVFVCTESGIAFRGPLPRTCPYTETPRSEPFHSAGPIIASVLAVSSEIQTAGDSKETAGDLRETGGDLRETAGDGRETTDEWEVVDKD